MNHEETEKIGRRERMARERARSTKEENTQPRIRREPYKRQQRINYLDDDPYEEYEE